MKHFLVTVLLCIAMTGCGGKPITKDNYSKVKTGMTLSEVESILGKGTEQGSSDASFGGISIDFKSMVWDRLGTRHHAQMSSGEFSLLHDRNPFNLILNNRRDHSTVVCE